MCVSGGGGCNGVCICEVGGIDGPSTCLYEWTYIYSEDSFGHGCLHPPQR